MALFKKKSLFELMKNVSQKLRIILAFRILHTGWVHFHLPFTLPFPNKLNRRWSKLLDSAKFHNVIFAQFESETITGLCYVCYSINDRSIFVKWFVAVFDQFFLDKTEQNKSCKINVQKENKRKLKKINKICWLITEEKK